jgi:hypothetical protein
VESKIGISGHSILLGFTAWLWLLPLACLYSQITVDQFFRGLLNLSIGGGANVLAILTITTAILGVITENLSFVFEKFFVGPTSGPRAWYTKHIGTVGPEHWHAAQERIWTSPQAHRDFVNARVSLLLSRALILNGLSAGVVYFIALGLRSWMQHFTLLLCVAIAAVLIGLISWWISTTAYIAVVRVAGDMQKKENRLILDEHCK